MSIASDYETAKRWRAALSIGDEALLPIGCIAKVTRTTATQVMFQVGHREIRYNRAYGREVGSSSYSSISPVTDKVREQIARKDSRTRFQNLTYRSNNLSDGEISAMLTALDAHRASLAAEQEPAK